MKFFLIFLLSIVSLPAFAEPAQFTVQARTKQQAKQSQNRQMQCNTCHAWRETNPTRRPLKQPHQAISIKHGRAPWTTLWCLDCHYADDNELLQTITPHNPAAPTKDEQQPANTIALQEIENIQKVCQRCHSKTVHDWQFGGHGKRVSGWQEERRILGCLACHDPHAPAWSFSTTKKEQSQ